MNEILKNQIIDLAKNGIRIDERKFDEYRKIEIIKNISKNAEGSILVKLGETEVMAGVKLDVGEPFRDRPDEGIIIVGAEFTPLSDPNFEPGPPGEDAIELARVVDRGIRESKMIDLKKLFIEEGKVWTIFLDIYTINNGGNLIDAANIASVLALANARIPKLEEGEVVYGELTNKKLPILKLPISITAAKIGKFIFFDPNYKEESVMDARLTVTFGENSKINAFQKGGEGYFTREEILNIVDIAYKKSKEIRKILEGYI